MGSVGEVLPSRDSTRIARTFILTLQRYELYSKLPNISAEICITTRHFFFFWGLFIPKDMKGTDPPISSIKRQQPL